MARSVLVDSSALVALLHRRDHHHAWAAAQAVALPQPWWTCEAAVSEAFFLLGGHGREPLLQLVERSAVRLAVNFATEHKAIAVRLASSARREQSERAPSTNRCGLPAARISAISRR